MTTLLEAALEFVAIITDELSPPAATVTLAGKVATAVLLLESVTIAPPAGARSVSVTVTLDVLPAMTLTGLRLIEVSATVEPWPTLNTVPVPEELF